MNIKPPLVPLVALTLLVGLIVLTCHLATNRLQQGLAQIAQKSQQAAVSHRATSKDGHATNAQAQDAATSTLLFSGQ